MAGMKDGDAAAVAGYYDRVAGSYLSGTRRTLHYEPAARAWVRAEAQRVSAEGRTPRVLDVGCGPGQVTGDLPGGVEVVGCDVSRGMVARARQARPDGRYFEHDYHEPLPAMAPVDVALAVGCFEFCRDLARVLGHLGRVMRPGGRLLMSVVERRAGLEGHEVERVVLSRRREGTLELRLFGLAEVAGAAAKAGWQPVAYRLQRGWSEAGHTWHYGMWELVWPDAPLYTLRAGWPAG